MRSTALAAGLCAMPLALAAIQPPDPGSVYELARRLTDAGVPVGVIVPTLVWRRGFDSPPPTTTPPRLRADDVPVLLRRFGAANPTLRVNRGSTVVRIRSVAEPLPVGDTLNRSVPIAEASRLSAAAVVLQKVLPIVLGEEPGIVGTGLSPGPTCRMDEDIVQLAPGTPTTPELLDSTVAQVPGLGWRVTYDPDAPTLALEVGLWCSDGSSIGVTAIP